MVVRISRVHRSYNLNLLKLPMAFQPFVNTFAALNSSFKRQTKLVHSKLETLLSLFLIRFIKGYHLGRFTRFTSRQITSTLCEIFVKF